MVEVTSNMRNLASNGEHGDDTSPTSCDDPSPQSLQFIANKKRDIKSRFFWWEL